MTHHRPHRLHPSRNTIRVAFTFKNFAATVGISHVGLGVTANNNANVLWNEGIWTDVWPLTNAGDIHKRLREAQEQAHRNGEPPISHVCISAFWIPTPEIVNLCYSHRNVTFVVYSHSNVAFLQADPTAVRQIRELSHLQMQCHNFRLGGNNMRFCQWARKSFHVPVAYLPNLYDCGTFKDPWRRPWDYDNCLQIGCFGATRPQKNIITAAGAALQLSEELKTKTEFHVSSGRNEGAGSIWNALKQMFVGSPRASLVLQPWRPWPEFRAMLGTMDVLMQPSFTESFNVVTADGIAEGVPSVVGEAIDWVPRRWVAQTDDVNDIAKVTMFLLTDKSAGKEGQDALQDYVRKGVAAWEAFLMHKG